MRQSNIELLRIVAMLLVLTVHAGFYSLGMPTLAETIMAPVPSFTRIFFQAVSVIAVLVFVLISGWFGIRTKMKSIVNFLLQCLFYSVAIFVVMLALGRAQCNWKSIQNVLLFINSFWFIKAYLCLMIFAPVLNAFVKAASEKQFRWVLVAFFVFQSLYGWLTKGAAWFEGGYSVVSFFGLYLLARYVRLYPCRIFTLPRKYDLLIYGALVLLMTVTLFVMIRCGVSVANCDVVFRLTSPFVIAEALYLLLFFSKLQFQNRFVNWMAASCFSVFLIQQNPYFGRPVYAHTIQSVYSQYSGIACILLIFAFILAIFCMAILVDQLRKKMFSIFKI